MSLHIQRQIDSLKKMILALGAQVEQMVLDSIAAVEQRDPKLAQTVIDSDSKIDSIEVDIEEECLHVLALNQPVAFDLRYIIATLKINNDLERMADLATNIARQAIMLCEQPPLNTMPFNLHEMGELVRSMVKQSLDALVGIDPDLAQQVCDRDEEVDEIHRQMYQRIEEAIEADLSHINAYLHLTTVSRSLERIGDHAQNVAEDVIYMAKGEIARHRRRT